MAAIGKHFDLHPLVIGDILNTDQRPKVDAFESYLFVVGRFYDSTGRAVTWPWIRSA